MLFPIWVQYRLKTALKEQIENLGVLFIFLIKILNFLFNFTGASKKKLSKLKNCLIRFPFIFFLKSQIKLFTAETQH